MTHDNTRVFIGAALNYTDMQTDFARGDGEGYAVALTGYGSWLSDSCLFFDVTAKYGTMTNQFNMQRTKVAYRGAFDTQFLSMTAEVGRRFDLPASFYVEPQLEVMDGHVFGESYTTSHRLRIEQDSFNSLIDRAGVQAGWLLPNDAGSIYARASYLYDWDADISTRFSMQDNGSGSYEQDLGGGGVRTGCWRSVQVHRLVLWFCRF